MHFPLLTSALGRRALTLALAAISCGAAASPASEPAPAAAGLTLETAWQLALQRSAQLPAIDAVARAARDRGVAAGQRPDPMLSLGLSNLPVEGSDRSRFTRESMTMRTIGLSQELPDDAKLRARARSFEQDALTALARKQAWRAELQRETALAWLAFRVEVQDLALLAQQRSEAALTTQAAEAVFRSGQGSQTDVFAARSAQARLADMALQTDARLHNARSALRRWIGPADDASPGPLPVIARAPPGMDPVSLRALVADWQALDPELQTAQAREAAARAAADAAREERRADWSVELSFSQRRPRYENMISLGFSVPLRWDPAQRQDRELSARLAQLQQAELETEELRRARAAELERWFINWQSGLARLAHHDEHLLPLARARAQAAVSAYASGSAPLLPALEARQAELVLHQERLRIEHETAADWSRLATFTSPAEVKP